MKEGGETWNAVCERREGGERRRRRKAGREGKKAGRKEGCQDRQMNAQPLSLNSLRS